MVTASWNSRRNRVRVTSVLGAPCADPSLNNIGATTTAVIDNWSCVPHPAATGCPLFNGALLGGIASNPGYQNLLLSVSTDAGGHIVSSNAYYTNEYKVLGFLFGFNVEWEAWDGGELVMGGVAQADSLRVRPSGGSPDINVKSGGNVSVVLYSHDNLDATQISNIAFGPGQAGLAHAAPHPQDMNGDGVDDLVMHFKQRDIGASCGDTTATLSADTAGGYPFSATAAINVVGCE